MRDCRGSLLTSLKWFMYKKVGSDCSRSVSSIMFCCHSTLGRRDDDLPGQPISYVAWCKHGCGVLEREGVYRIAKLVVPS